MTNFEKWKKELTVEEAAMKLAESMFVCGFCPARKSRKLCNGTCQENFIAWANAPVKEEE